MVIIGRAELCPNCHAPILWIRALGSDKWTPVSDYPPAHDFDFGPPNRLDWTGKPPTVVESHPVKACPNAGVVR